MLAINFGNVKSQFRVFQVEMSDFKLRSLQKHYYWEWISSFLKYKIRSTFA